MSPLRLIVFALIGTLLTCATVRGGDEKQPFEIVRDIQLLQDHMAAGDAIAQAVHAKAIERAARSFAKAKPSTWADARNARALIVYLFSGGNAQVIASAVPAGAIAKAQREIYVGAISYGLGDDVQARAHLMPIDAKSLPNSMGAQLALVQATLCTQHDNAKAIQLLDLARLLAPGTLIEEAALRKEMSLIGATGNIEKYAMLARRYLGAFSHSIYADNFRQLVAAAALQIGAADSDEAAQRIAKLSLSLTTPERRKVYLAIAKEAVLSGRVTMASLASQEVVRIADRASPDETRALVYFGAAAIVGDRYELAEKTLVAASTDRLAPTDRALRTSALAVAEMIRRRPAGGEVDKTLMRPGVIADGERALNASDETLKRAAAK